MGSLALVLGFAWLYWLQSTDDQLPVDYAKAEVARRDGQFALAHELIDGLGTDWANERVTRKQKLSILEQRLAATEAAVEAKRAEVVATFPTYAGALASLRNEEVEGSNQQDRDVAAIVRSSLRETFIELQPARDAATFLSADHDPSSARSTLGQDGGTLPLVDPVVVHQDTLNAAGVGGESMHRSAPVQSAELAASTAAERGAWREALEHQHTALLQSENHERAAVFAELGVLKRRIREASSTLVVESNRLVEQGRADVALSTLRDAAPRFPSVGDLAKVAGALRDLESRVANQAMSPSPEVGASTEIVATAESGGALRAPATEVPETVVHDPLDRTAIIRIRTRLRKNLLSVLKRGPEERSRFLSEILGEGEQVATLLQEQLAWAYQRELVRVERASTTRELNELFATRDQLEAARDHALKLIFDQGRYFMPYKAPAVSAARAAEYQPVQREVNARVEGVQVIWDDPKRVSIPRDLRSRMDALEWLTTTLEEFGGEVLVGRVLMDRISLLPVGASVVSIRDVAQTTQEARRLKLYVQLRALNAARAKELPRDLRDLAVVTNDYRMMMGRRPLVIDSRLLAAASLHAKDMAKRGFFSHYTPEPNATSPLDRMGSQGYDQPTGENIAKGRAPVGCHALWLQSSGHHRNILIPSHTEFGFGESGRYVVQVFGRGGDHLDDPRLGNR